jgi:hypothetical protein
MLTIAEVSGIIAAAVMLGTLTHYSFTVMSRGTSALTAIASPVRASRCLGGDFGEICGH